MTSAIKANKQYLHPANNVNLLQTLPLAQQRTKQYHTVPKCNEKKATVGHQEKETKTNISTGYRDGQKQNKLSNIININTKE